MMTQFLVYIVITWPRRVCFPPPPPPSSLVIDKITSDLHNRNFPVCPKTCCKPWLVIFSTSYNFPSNSGLIPDIYVSVSFYHCLATNKSTSDMWEMNWVLKNWVLENFWNCADNIFKCIFFNSCFFWQQNVSIYSWVSAIVSLENIDIIEISISSYVWNIWNIFFQALRNFFPGTIFPIVLMIIALYCKGPCIVPVCGHIDQTKHRIPISEPNREWYQLPHHCGQLHVPVENACAI